MTGTDGQKQPTSTARMGGGIGWGLKIGIPAALLCIAGAILQPAAFFHAYLFAYLFWLGIALGSLALLMAHHLAGGGWGFVIRRLLEGAMMTLPLMAILFVPIALGMPYLYSWTHAGAITSDPVLQHKSAFFLSVPWFFGRAALYFAVWMGLAWTLRRWSLTQDSTQDPEMTRRFQKLCGPGLVLYTLTMSFAAIDWAMALEPHWYSTIFSLIVICGQGLSALAFAIPIAVWLFRHQQSSFSVSKDTLQELGHLLLAGVLLWTYMAYSQYIIIWSGNEAHEVTWYLHRRLGGWSGVSAFLTLFHFFVPFVLLLFGGLKRSSRALGAVALGLLAAHLIENYWLVMPSFGHHAWDVTWLDLVLPVGIGGLWWSWFCRQVDGKPLIPEYDPRLEEHIRVQEASHG